MTDLTTVADELYALTPAEFTKARNDRAKQAKPGDQALAEAIARLPKPSTAAWVVNALVRRSAEELEQVLTLGAALRQAQENLDGAELRDLNKQRRQLTAAVTNQARELANTLGVKVSSAVGTQVEETLRAAMTDEGATKAVRTGQLVEALSATGIGELDVSSAVAVPEAIGMSARPVERAKPKLKIVEDPDQPEGAGEQRAEQDAQVLAQAERTAREAREAVDKADKKLDKARKKVANLEARSLQLQGELEEVRRRAGELEHALEAVDDDLSSAEEKRERAEEREEKARSAAEEAQAALAEIQ